MTQIPATGEPEENGPCLSAVPFEDDGLEHLTAGYPKGYDPQRRPSGDGDWPLRCGKRGKPHELVGTAGAKDKITEERDECPKCFAFLKEIRERKAAANA